MKKTVLIVEDDRDIARLVEYNLEKSGFTTASVHSGEDALERLERDRFDLVVLDIMLPGLDGFEVCRRIKRSDRLSHVPVLMLTAKGEEVDRIVGLELGADDYVVKPFSPRELVLRAKAVLRRRAPDEEASQVMRAGDVEVDLARHVGSVGGVAMDLTPLEFRLLATLMKRRGRVQSRDVLLEDVWGISSTVTTRTVDTHIKRLRRKLGASGGLILTVRGLGYKLSEEE
jgi:two-component system phosphate regulon response regulator PhoB